MIIPPPLLLFVLLPITVGSIFGCSSCLDTVACVAVEVEVDCKNEVTKVDFLMLFISVKFGDIDDDWWNLWDVGSRTGWDTILSFGRRETRFVFTNCRVDCMADTASVVTVISFLVLSLL